MILTQQDLSDPENVRECAAQYRRAALNQNSMNMDAKMQSIGALAMWAGFWGEGIVKELEEPTDHDEETKESLGDELSQSEEALALAEVDVENLKSAISKAADALSDLRDRKDMPDSISDDIEPILKILEKAENA